jgi:hypothetical protein
MAVQTPDDSHEASSYEIAYQKIGNLLQRLHDKSVCPECTSRAMALHAAAFAEYALGSAAAIQLLEDMIVHMREHDAPAPERPPSTHVH